MTKPENYRSFRHRRTCSRVGWTIPSLAALSEDIFTSCPDVIVVLDRDLRLVAVNPSASKWLPADLKPEDAIGKSLVELLPFVVSSGRYEQYLEVLRKKQPVFLVTEPTHPVFGPRQMLLRIFPIRKGLVIAGTELNFVRRAIERSHSLGDAHLSLSEREYDIFLRLAAGQSQREAADSLGLSIKTVNTYRRRLMRKLGMTTKAELTRYAIEHKLL